MRARLATLATLALLFAARAHADPTAYVMDPAGSSLAFHFTQAGAQNEGQFRRFAVNLRLDPAQLAASRLDVSVEIASVDTGDKDRDATLRGADLFDAAHFPQARFVSSSIQRIDATHYRAVGTLTLRNVTHPLTVPFSLLAPGGAAANGGASAASGAAAATTSMSGQLALKRLDFGVGQGEWKSTEWVGNEVAVSFSLRLRP